MTGTVGLGNNVIAENVSYGGISLEDGASGNTIGGLTATPGTGAGNLVSDNATGGVVLNYAGSNNLVAGNLIGTDVTGTVALGNLFDTPVLYGGYGVDLNYSPGNTVGEPGGRNVISGNGADGPGTTNGANVIVYYSSGSAVQSNFIGTDITGTVAISSNTYNMYVGGGSSITIGGLTPTPGTGLGNVISGNNDEFGLGIAGVTGSVVVLGNIIGADATGEHELPNAVSGVSLSQASGVTIGGTAAGAGNLISGDSRNGNEGNIDLDQSSNNAIEGNKIGTDITGLARLPALPGDANSTGVEILSGSTDNTIGGTTAAARNIISGINGPGIYIADPTTTGNVVLGNDLGTDQTGTMPLGNQTYGVGPFGEFYNPGDGVIISDAPGNTIGGTSAGAGNLISANADDGIEITGATATGNLILGNGIGSNLSGTDAMGNGVDGVEIDTGASGNTIGGTTAGAGNTIADNTNDGVQVVGNGTTGDAIRGNSIFANGVLGIELGTSGVPSTNILGGSTSGPNDQQNYPVLTIVSYTPGTGTTIAGDINTTPNTEVFVDLYADTVKGQGGYGQGQTYVGSVTVTTTIDGNASFTYLSTSLPRNAIVSATATDPGNTSEFSLDQAEDTPPIAAIVARPSPAGSPATTFNEGQSITFDGSGSYSPDGDSLDYTWDFNDGSPLVTTTTPTVTHAYHYDGTYVVTLTVNDGHGGIESNIDILTIKKLPPVIAFNALPASLAVGTTLNLSGTIDDPTPDLETVVLDWGDGSSPTTLQLPAGSTTFSSSYDYASPLPGGATTATLSATVTDASNPAASPEPSPIGPLSPTPPFDVGGLSGSTSAMLTVFQQAPTIAGLTLSQSTVNVGGTTTLSGTIVDPDPVVSHTVTIQWGDPSPNTTLVLPPGDLVFSSTHQYDSTPGNALSGAWPIDVTVINSNLASGAVAPPAVTAVDVSPIVQIESLPLSTSGSLVSLISIATEPPGTHNQLTYQWTLTTGGAPYASGTGQTLSFVSISGGVFTATVVVTDQDGATGQASAQVVVGPSTPNNTVVFNPAGAGLVTITANGTTSSPFAPGNGIIYYSRGATNVVEASPTLTTPIELVGSTGGTNTLIGGAGDDTLVSVQGNDYLEGTTGNTDFVLILGHDPTLVGSTGINTIDLSQTPQNVTLNLGTQTVQSVDSAGDIVLLQGTFQNVIAGPGDDVLTAANGVSGSLIGGSGNDIIYGGTTGNDSITGGTGNSTITGGGGNDIIYGGTTGNDSITGGTGNSTITGGGGNDIIYGGTTGNDSITGGTGNSTITGGGGNDIIYGGTTGNDSITGGTGNSTITGGGGNDIIYGGTTGNDSITGGTGNSTITGGGGNDIIYGGTTGNDSITGGTGNSTITGGGGNDIIYGGTTGNDSITGGTGNSTITGGGGNDIIYGGTTGNDSIVGGTGNSTITGGGGNDIIYGGTTGNDSITGGTGNSTITGGGGNDIIYGGTTGNDSVTGGTGNSTITGGGGNDIIYGGTTGNDSITGGTGNSTITGGGGNDIIYGGTTGNDSITGGTGNSTITGGGGNDIIYGGTTGNDSITGGTGNSTITGGGGNDIIYGGTTGNDSITGGTGNSTITGGGGNDIIYGGTTGNDSITGGTGNSTITGGGGNDIIYGGTTGNDSITGGTGNSTITGGGGNDIIYGGTTGNDSIVGGTGNATISGGGGNDIIYGGTTGNDSITGGTGNSTITGGGGNDIIFGGPGNDLIFGGTGYNTISGGGGSDIISGGPNDWLIETDPLGNTQTLTTVTLTNSSLTMPGFGTDAISGITNVVVGLGDGKILLDASQNTAPLVLVGGTGDDTILAGPGDDTMYAGSGNDSLVGGGGNDTYVFGPLTQGNVTVNDGSTTNNALDFSLFGAGINLDLEAVGPQAVSPGLLNLTLTNPLSINEVVGTPYPDSIQGNGRNDTLIGNGGDNYLNARGGAALIEGFQTQVVYLDFLPGVVDYSAQSTRDAIEAGIGAIYSAFNFTFTQTQPTSGTYETLYYNIPGGSLLAGEATELDWRNIDLGGSAVIDISQFLGEIDQPADTLTNIINMSVTIGAHELGHLSGLIHGDSFGPIGAGIYANLADNPYLDGFNPPYPGPANAVDTLYDVMGSPAAVGTSLFDAADVTFFGERDDIAMAFADSGTTTSETPGDPNTSVATAQPVTLSPLSVPNTLLIGQGTGDSLDVTAADVDGSIGLGASGQSNADYYAITATAGELLNFQVFSQSLTRDDETAIDSELTIYEADGKTVVPYYGSATGAFNDDGFQDADAVLYDVTMPYTGTYYVKVSTYAVTDSFGILHNSDLGNYELFMYSFAATPSGGTPSANGDTLVGSSGQDTLVGSSASDLIEAVPGDSVISGSGADTIDTLPYDIEIADPALQLGTPVALTGSFVASNPGMAYMYDWHVAASNGQVISDESGTAAVNAGAGTTSFQFTPADSGAYTITLTITDGYGGVNQATLEETAGTITPFTSQIGTGASEIAGASGTPTTLSATATGAYPVASYMWMVSAPTAVTPPAPGSGASYTFTPTAAGNYTVTMTATDTAREVAVSTVTVIVPSVAPSALIIGVPANEYVPEGYAFSLAGVVNNPTPGNTLTESWTVTAGNGSEAPYTVSGPNVTYTPDDIGSYTVTLNVLNASNQIVASASQQIISIGVAPMATISGGPSGGTTTEGTTLAFSGAASSPSTVTSAAGFFYTWGVTFGAFTYVAPTTPTVNPSNFSFTPGQAGTYVVSLSVTDCHGFTSVAATQTIAVAAVAPSVTITGLPAGSVTAGTTVALESVVTNPSAVLQSAGFSESWTVQFDGATYRPYFGPALNLTLGSVGSYTVVLSATDAEGISSTTTQMITAADTAPVVTPSASPTVQPPEQATITAYNLGSVVGPGLDSSPGFVTVNWGDGTLATSFPISSQGELGVAAHAYELPGEYQVSVTVTDGYGLSGSDSFTTTVAPVPPSPEIQSAPASMNAGSSVILSSSVTDPSQAETAAGYTYAWSVQRNGSPYTLPGSPSTSSPSFVFAPTLGGSYTISLATTDSSGSVGTAPPQRIVVNNLDTTTSLASSANPSVSGQGVTFTATVSVNGPGSNAVPNPTGTVTFYDSGVAIGTGTLSGTPTDTATFATSTLSAASHTITAAYTSGDGSFNASPVSASISQVVNKASTTTMVSSSPNPSVSGQSVTFTATVSIAGPGSNSVANPTGTVTFYDSGVAIGTGTLSGTATDTATFVTSTLSTAKHAITAAYTSGNGNFSASPVSASISQVVNTASMSSGSIYVLDPTAGGALTLSGNAGINVPGDIIVDSSSSTAITASGNASVKGARIQVHGAVQKSGNATFSPAPITGASVVSNPLGGLTAPAYSGTPVSETLSGNSTATINPGVYSQITVSGNASLTLDAGIYVIAGGGLSVSGNANVTGTGVMIYNTKSSTGTYGSITLSGNGTIKLTAPTTGAYAGMLIFQDVNNSKALTFSGNAMQGISGTIYAPAAQLVESGNAQVGSSTNPISIVVDTLTISGNAIANALSLSSPAGTVAYTPAQIRAAYGINNLTLDGTGETIAIVDAYDDPAIYPALDAFDTQFGLTSAGATLYQQYGPASSFLTVLNQNGQTTSLPGIDPNGAGTDNWEAEEALDVEWAHAIAPGAQIILVEANSQSLPDLMAGAATAASQPGVSVVSMSWGFAEGQAVFASDEATYDNVFTTHGVTFVASTGDHGAADPEYPAFSPDVVSVGGTSLTLNADNSYNSETGFGYESNALGTFIGSGGGISLYEPEPAYQERVQSTGDRTIPDVSLVADPATGAWVADPYNVAGSNPFEIVGGTSLSAPAWAGLLALVNQGSVAAGGSTLNSASPTETGQALYGLPQSDYNVINSGTNGYSAQAGYNLVTGLGTPVANLLVPDLVAYQSDTFVAAGPTVTPLSNVDLVNTGASAGGTINEFNVFDSVIDTGAGVGSDQTAGSSGMMNPTLARAAANPDTASGLPAQSGHGPGLTTIVNPGSLTLISPLAGGNSVVPIETGLGSRHPGGPAARRQVNATAKSCTIVLSQRADHSGAVGVIPTKLVAGRVSDAVLNELAVQALKWPGRLTDGSRVLPAHTRAGIMDRHGLKVSGFAPVSTEPLLEPVPAEQPADFRSRLAAILLAVGSLGHRTRLTIDKNLKAGSVSEPRKSRKSRRWATRRFGPD